MCLDPNDTFRAPLNQSSINFIDHSIFTQNLDHVINNFLWFRMAEAKERSSTPVIPTDMQAVLKRCENLEKEVRSLKLNLSFMNR